MTSGQGFFCGEKYKKYLSYCMYFILFVIIT